ncbi:MAG TPA: MFS transporter [Intrasporangium sp.]|nr:MFS transporter [Intrasporangium sp.]
MSTTSETLDTPATSPHPRRWRALGLLAVANLMLILDVTVVAVALPQLGADLGMSRDALTWVMSGYTLAFGGLMLTGGRLADLFGPRRIVVTGLGLFTFASLLAGLANGPGMIIAARVGQGLGAALMSPAALSLVVRLFDGEERNRALGIWSALGGVGAALGVLLGGLITAGPGWEWVFLVNLPVGAVVLVALPRVLPPMPAPATGGRLDLVGAALVTAASGLLIYAFIDAGDSGWGSSRLFALLSLTLLLFLGLARWLSRATHALVDPKLVVRRPVIAGAFVLFVGTAIMVAVFFLGTFFLQEAAGHGPLTTGLLFLPVAVATMTGAQLAGRAIGRLGARTLAVTGLLVAAAGLLGAAIGDNTATTVAAVSLASAGLGALFVVASATALGSVEQHEAGVASGLLSTFHELGASLGAAVMSGVAAASLTAGSTDGFRRGYTAAAAIALASAVISWFLFARSGRGGQDAQSVADPMDRPDLTAGHGAQALAEPLDG